MRMQGLMGMIALAAILGATGCSGGGEEERAAPESATQDAGTSTTAGAADATVQLAGLTGTSREGERVFAQCRTCHSLSDGENRVGPSLYGIVGRPAGTAPDFRYSEANRQSGVVWTEQVLFDYLENPRVHMRGTTMSFAGLREPQRRVDVIAYLKANGPAG